MRLNKIVFSIFCVTCLLTACHKNDFATLSVDVSCATQGFVVQYGFDDKNVEQVVAGNVFHGEEVRVPIGAKVTALAQAIGTHSQITLSVLKNGKVVKTATDTGDYCLVRCEVMF